MAGLAEVQVRVQAPLACYSPHPFRLLLAQSHGAGSLGCLRRQSWGQMLGSLLSTASQWPSGQVLMLGEQVEKFLVIPTTQSGQL